MREAKHPDPNSGKFEPIQPQQVPKNCEVELYMNNDVKGEAMSKEIGAVKYMEICSKTGQGVNEVFQEAVNLVLKDRDEASKPSGTASGKPNGKNKKKNNCTLL